MGDPVRPKRKLRDGVAARPAPRTDRGRAGIVCLVLAAIVFIVFGQTLGHEFVNYDDNKYVYENPRIANGLSLDGIQWAFTHVHAGNWHPLHHFAHAGLPALRP